MRSQRVPPDEHAAQELGIEIHEGVDAAQLEVKPDCVVVGNVMSRGVEVVEAMLDSGMPYTSGPRHGWQRMYCNDRHVLAVAGTHGKTTTASMLAWILEDAGLAPGFLIGGIPTNFGTSARFGESKYFVVEADEYDTAFFDKRAKFVHYRPRTLVLNNLEFDHADIYKDMDAILWQFHQLLRTVPGNGRIISNRCGREPAADLSSRAAGRRSRPSVPGEDADWTATLWRQSRAPYRYAGSRTARQARRAGRWAVCHNLENALAAVAAAAFGRCVARAGC